MTREFYIKQCHEHMEGALKAVCPANGISLDPQEAKDLRAIPVYEGDTCLLSLANGRRVTTITWPDVKTQYLEAYWKKYKLASGQVQQDIVVNASNYCYARFYAAKELMHCLVDDDGYPASDTIELVNDLIASLASGGHMVPGAKPQTMVDEIAYYGAILYMVPDAWMPMIQKLHAAIAMEFPSVNATLHVAQILRVPEIVLDVRLRAN
jgi:hypothetical protein